MIKLLVVILNKDKNLKTILKKYKLSFNIITYARGTASKSILSYFGLDEVKKDIYFSLIPSSLEEKILTEIETKLKLKRRGEGIGFTIGLKSSNKFIKDILESSDLVMSGKNEYSLVVTIVKEGLSDHVMNAAKKVGATGGTVLYGRSLGSSRTIFASIQVEPEKDIVLNIVSNEIKDKVMESINKEAGIKTEARGVIMSFKIDNIIGLND